jgi:hypothetical protein
MYKTVLVFMLLCCFSTGVFARDVDLDGIYIRKSSQILPRLTGAKLDLYAAAGATLAADGVSFAGWSSGARIIYTRETSDRVALMEYFTGNRHTGTIASVDGGVVHARIPVNSRYAFLSVLAQGKAAIPESFFVTIDNRSGEVKKYPSRSVFVDYGLSRYGASFIREEKNDLVETFPDTLRRRTVLTRSQYGSVSKKNAVTTALPSPDFRRVLVLSGEGGSYDAAVFEDGVMIRLVDGVSSGVDITWVDNKLIAYRTGSPGNYSVRLFNCTDGTSSRIGERTLNTNISYCEYNGTLSYLTDGAISFCKAASGQTEVWPLEGEDIAFAPGGNSFCALYGGRLFIVQRETVKSRAVELRRAAAKVLAVYRELLAAPAEWENGYSREYLVRKIALYEKLSAGK